MAETNQNEVKAPVYRYFTVDLMSNKILMEIPFQKVSYERALKAAGSFSGEIAVIEQTKNLELYETTTPGNTALFVIRDGICVWGGIIWARDYSVKSKLLDVSASEFTSYFHHRLIWKTLNFQYGASVDVVDFGLPSTSSAINQATNPTALNNIINWGVTPSTNPSYPLYPIQGTDKTEPGYSSVTGKSSYVCLAIGASSSVYDGITYTDYITPGAQYNFSIYAGIASNSTTLTNKLQMQITWLDNNNVAVGNPVSAPVQTMNASWQQYSMKALLAPQGATQARLSLFPGSTGTAWASGSYLIAEAVRFAWTPTTSDPAFINDITYFSGDTPDPSPAIYYGWEGSPNASVSTYSIITKDSNPSPSITTVTIDNGSAREIVIGATIGLEFYEPENFRYNGNYSIVRRDDPNGSGFQISSAVTATVNAVERRMSSDGFNDAVYFYTSEPHGFSDGDTIVVSGLTGSDAQFNGTYSINIPENAGASTSFWVMQTTYFNVSNIKTVAKHDVLASAGRFLPLGVHYDNVTLTVHTDTYDYIRGLVQDVWSDFLDIKFADDYLTPGTTNRYNIIGAQVGSGYATITTDSNHGLVVGQAVTISEFNAMYDGTWVVAGVPTSTSFSFALGGYQNYTTVLPTGRAIASRQISNGVATISWASSTPSNPFYPGDLVTINAMEDYDGLASIFTGVQTVSSSLTSRSLSFSTTSTASSSPQAMQQGTAAQFYVASTTSGGVNVYQANSFGAIDGYSLTNGILTCHFVTPLISDQSDNTGRKPVIGSRANIHTLPFTRTIAEKSIDAPNRVKSIVTNQPHNLDVGDVITVYGDSDVYDITHLKTSNKSTTFTTSAPHNLIRGDTTTMRNLTDAYTNVALNGISSKTLSDGTKTYFARVAVNGGKHNIPYPGAFSDPGANDINGPTLQFNNFYSYFKMNYVSIKNKLCTITTSQPHTFFPSDTVTISGIHEQRDVVSAEVRNGIAILTLSEPHNMHISEEITVSGVGAPYDSIPDVTTVILAVTDTRVLYQLQDASGNDLSNVNKAGVRASGKVTSTTDILDGSFVVASVPSSTTLTFTIEANDTSGDLSGGVSNIGGPSILRYGVMNGNILDPNNPSYSVTGINADRSLNVFLNLPAGLVPPVYSGTIPVSSSNDTNVTPASLTTTNYLSDLNVIVDSVTQNTFTVHTTFPSSSRPTTNYYKDNRPLMTSLYATDLAISGGQTSTPSEVNGKFYVTEVVTDYRVNYYYGASTHSASWPTKSILETPTVNSAFFRLDYDYLPGSDADYLARYPAATASQAYPGWSNAVSTTDLSYSQYTGPAALKAGTGATVYAYDLTANTVSFTLDRNKRYGAISAFSVTSDTSRDYYKRSGGRYHKNIPYTPLVATAPTVVRQPVVSAGTYGPFPGNTNLGMKFSTSQYSGVNVDPTAYRGYTLTNVGDALDSYSSTTNGFEYRIDCDYDADSDSFSKTFVLIPVNFPDPPNNGEVSDPSRFGADKIVFEYPGSVMDVKLAESAENSATRFFAVGDANLGADAANPYSAASNLGLLDANSDRKWPILDDKESVADISDEDILNAYAQQYLNEAKPPAASFTISIDGSLQPPIGSFLPGDWCSVIINDDFIQARLRSKLEPRDTVLVRKIDSYKVTVPDGNTFPETVDLTLLADWNVDTGTSN
jgi:hypothetical protein